MISIGYMTNNVWSYRLQNNIGFGLVEAGFNPGDQVTVRMHGKSFEGSSLKVKFEEERGKGHRGKRR